MAKLNRLIEIMTDIAEGTYANNIGELTDSDTEEPVRTIAAAMEPMMAKIESRKKHLEMLTRQVEEANLQPDATSLQPCPRWLRRCGP